MLNFRTLGRLKSIYIIAGLAVLAGCTDDDDNGNGNGQQQNDPKAYEISVDPATTYQTIAGFGGASRMWGNYMQPSVSQTIFGMGDDELGLSIFRIRVAPDTAGWQNTVQEAKAAQDLGATIIASPWTPPAHMKSNNDQVGGVLLQENYGAFKDHLNAYIEYMDEQGVDIYAISVQNEPDIQVSYQSCDWTPNTMANFLAQYGDSIEGALVIAPESYNFSQSFTNTLLNDNEASESFDIVGGHIYGGGLEAFPIAEQQGKEVWMTEYLMNLNTGQDGAPEWTTYSDLEIWQESMQMLNTIHQSMELNWNAYIWWYAQRYYSFVGEGDEGTTTGEILKRGYAFSQFSKFVRPGYTRIGVQTEEDDLDITAYMGDGKTVVVIINPEQASVKNVELSVPSASSATAYVTGHSADREEREVEIAEDVVSLETILGLSITTVIIEE